MVNEWEKEGQSHESQSCLLNSMMWELAVAYGL